jgi:phenylalanyl-tRNA synthetase beta chain
MPMIEVKIWDLERLAKATLTVTDIENVMINLKGELESIDGEDVIFEASHDRPDLFSAEGLGRAIGYLKGTRQPTKIDYKLSDIALNITEAPKYRPYALIAVVRNVFLDDEAIKQLFQLQEKLHVSYGGDRSLVSIGLYDLDKLEPPIRYVTVKKAEFIPLGEDRKMTLKEILRKTEKGLKYSHLIKEGEYPLLIDSEDQVLSFPPIINNEVNKVTIETKNVLIDVTGVEPELMRKILTIVTLAVAERGDHASIEIAKIVDRQHEYIAFDLSGRTINLSLSRVRSLLGKDLDHNIVAGALQKHGYIVEDITEEYVNVWVPPYRVDVMHTVDIIEDIAIGVGYSNFIGTPPPPTHRGAISSIERFSDIVREIMIGLGFEEIVNFMLIDSDFLKKYSTGEFIELVNPKLKTYSAVRNSLIPSILLATKENSEVIPRFKIFEIGDIILIRNDDTISERTLGFGIYSEDITLTNGLIVIKALMRSLGLHYKVREAVNDIMIKGRIGEIIVDNEVVGLVGEIHPKTLYELGLAKPLVIGEIFLSRILKKLVSS